MTMKISFEIGTAEDFEKLRRFFLSGNFATGEEREEESFSPLSPPLPFPPTTPYPITPFNSPSFQEEEREEETQNSRAGKNSRGQLREFGPHGNVLLSDAEYDKLYEKFHFNKLQDLIERMDCYLEEDEKRKRKYKTRNHYMTLLNWARKDEKEKKQSYSFRDIVEMGA